MHVTGPYVAVGWRFSVRASRPAVGRQLAHVLSSLRASGPADGAVYELTSPRDDVPGRLTVDGADLLLSFDEPLLYATLLWHVNQGVVESSSDHVLLHASAAESAGSAVVMCAPTESGKSTLVAGLVLAGLRYLTDEAVAVRPTDGLITPYPKALSIDDGSWDVLEDLRPDLPAEVRHLQVDQWNVPPTDIRADAVAPPARPRLVVFPRYVEGAPTSWEPVPRAKALVELLHNAFTPGRQPARDLTVLADVVRGSTCYRLRSGSLQGAVAQVLAALDSPVGPASPSWP